MAKDLSDLDPVFRDRLERALEAAKAVGVSMVPYETIRTPASQGALWRQSRPKVVVDLKILKLRKIGAGFLADCIEKSGPQRGPHVTNALPGESWHQWGQACDLYWEKEPGKAEWNDLTGYARFAEICAQHGLNHGYLWKSFRDSVHVQLPVLRAPSMDLVAISREMAKRFGGK